MYFAVVRYICSSTGDVPEGACAMFEIFRCEVVLSCYNRPFDSRPDGSSYDLDCLIWDWEGLVATKDAQSFIWR